MPEIISKWNLADSIVRITLLRILPGHELEVGREIESRCKKIGLKKDNFRIFRLFGSYDLVLIQDQASLTTSDFIRLGSLPYIIGTNEYLCYNWQHQDRIDPTFKIERLSNPLVAVCFLKINPLIIQQSGIRPELDFAEYIGKKLGEVQMVGSLGWFGVVLLISENSLSRILHLIGSSLPGLIYQHKSESSRYFFAEKTLSLLGHELDVSDPGVKSRRCRVRLFENDLTREDLCVHLVLSCKPRAMHLLKEEARKHFMINDKEFNVNLRFGAKDLDFEVPLQNIDTLNDLLYKLDNFRKANMGILVKTFTDIQTKKHQPPKITEDYTDDVKGYLKFEIDTDQAARLVEQGQETSAVLAATYRYNSLVENDLVADAYVDLLKFVKTTRDLAKNLEADSSIDKRRQIISRLGFLEEAIEQRSQGVYAGLEEAPFSWGMYGNGMLKVSKALEALICKLLRRFSKDWNGFVLFGNSSKFAHFDEVIIVPTADSLCARKHWAITHESMHILQNKSPERLSPQNILPVEKDSVFYKYRINDVYGELFHEIVADVLDFAFCCPLDIKEYMDIIWGYLNEGVFEYHRPNQKRAYLFRSFGVIIYNYGQKTKKLPSDWLSPRGIEKILKDFKRFKNYKSLEYLFEQDQRGQTEYEIFIKEFIDEYGLVLPYVISVINEMEGKVSKHEISKKKISNAIKKLEQGRLLLDADMENTEAIAWILAKKTDASLSDKASIAWILSLWNLYHTQTLGFNLKKLIGE